MADIETLLGLNAGSGADMQALAAKLRGQQKLGDFLALSTIPQAAQMGSGERRAALGSARAGGRLVQAQQARDEQARRFDTGQERLDERQQYREGRDRVLDQRYAAEQEYTRGKLGEAEVWKDPATGDLRTVQQRDDGTYQDMGGSGEPVDLSGWEPIPKRSSRGMGGYKTGVVKIEGVPVMYSADRAGRDIQYQLPGSSEWVGSEDEVRAALDERGARETAAAGDMAVAEATGKRLPARIDALTEARAPLRLTEDLYSGAIEQIKYDANTGPVASMLWSARGPTKALYNIQEQLGLAINQTAKLTPLSDPDREMLLRTAIPDGIDESSLIYWLAHKRESWRRAQEVNEFRLERLRETREEPTQAEIDAIAKRDDFSFATPPATELGGLDRLLGRVLDDDAIRDLSLVEKRQMVQRMDLLNYGR